MSDFSKFPIILYDDECTLCKRFKLALVKLDTKKELNFIDLHRDEVYKTFPFLSKNECENAIHLIDEKHQVYRAGEVIQFLVSYFPGVKKLSWLLDNDSAKKALDIFYYKVAEIREKSNCTSCSKASKKNHK